MSSRNRPDEQLQCRLRAWRRYNVHIGLVPRASAFWSGLLYREPHGAIAEYAQLFDTALFPCGGAPDAALLARLGAQAGNEFRWTLLVDGDEMTYRFPHGHPERRKRGELNAQFLDPRRTWELVAPLVRLVDTAACVVLLNIRGIYATEALEFGDFLGALTRCLDGLPPVCRFAVANGTPRFMLPEYFALLGERNVMHVPGAAALAETLRTPGALGADACLVRSACLTLDEEGEEWAAFRTAVRLCLEGGKPLRAYLTAGEDAPAPCGAGAGRLTRLLAGLDPELARRSPIRRKAA
ncbi:MAG TPA: hypothetical protein VMM80_06590 [Bacteroidota bacterium]|nr:hypothetical protein [Bacteroidota bacterium]